MSSKFLMHISFKMCRFIQCSNQLSKTKLVVKLVAQDRVVVAVEQSHANVNLRQEECEQTPETFSNKEI